MAEPVRLQLSRRKGFDLQAWSREVNGLAAVNVARPGKWGNPFDFRRGEYCWAALSFRCRGDRLGRQEASVRAFRDWIAPPFGRRTISWEEQPRMGNGEATIDLGPPLRAAEAPSREEIIATLCGKNLACWCKPGEPCHADVLLELANSPPEGDYPELDRDNRRRL